MSSNPIQVFTTVPDKADAERLATSLVAKGLAACVQVHGPIGSTYRWKGNVQTSQEWACTIKTLEKTYDQVEGVIRELHSYSEPEIIVLPIVAGSASYLQWLVESVKPE